MGIGKMEKKLLDLIVEAEERSKIVPNAEPLYEQLLEALEKARLIAEEWDSEMRRAGLNA